MYNESGVQRSTYEALRFNFQRGEERGEERVAVGKVGR